jgi:hypothetical protein
LLTGVRTEEAKAPRWSHVVTWVEQANDWRPVTEVGFDHKKFAVYVWRSVRQDGDTKTEKSRRTLEIPDQAAGALRQHHTRQAAQRLKAGDRWQADLVFCTGTGTAQARDHDGRNHDEHHLYRSAGRQVRLTAGSPFGSRQTSGQLPGTGTGP